MLEIATRVTRSVDTSAGPDAVYALLADVPRSVAHFPDVESVGPDGDVWIWVLRRQGAGPIQFQVHYGARYRFDPATRLVAWDAVPGVGNTRVDGRWAIAPGSFTLDARFTLTTPFPRPLRGAVEAIVNHQTGRLIGGYLDNLSITLSGGDGRVRRG